MATKDRSEITRCVGALPTSSAHFSYSHVNDWSIPYTNRVVKKKIIASCLPLILIFNPIDPRFVFNLSSLAKINIFFWDETSINDRREKTNKFRKNGNSMIELNLILPWEERG